MATIRKDGTVSSIPLSFGRTNAQPLDSTAVFYSLAEAQAYASAGVTSYVGQVISIVDEEHDTSSVYVIINKQGDLVEVGSSSGQENEIVYYEVEVKDGQYKLANSVLVNNVITALQDKYVIIKFDGELYTFCDSVSGGTSCYRFICSTIKDTNIEHKIICLYTDETITVDEKPHKSVITFNIGHSSEGVIIYNEENNEVTDFNEFIDSLDSNLVYQLRDENDFIYQLKEATSNFECLEFIHTQNTNEIKLITISTDGAESLDISHKSDIIIDVEFGNEHPETIPEDIIAYKVTSMKVEGEEITCQQLKSYLIDGRNLRARCGVQYYAMRENDSNDYVDFYVSSAYNYSMIELSTSSLDNSYWTSENLNIPSEVVYINKTTAEDGTISYAYDGFVFNQIPNAIFDRSKDVVLAVKTGGREIFHRVEVGYQQKRVNGPSVFTRTYYNSDNKLTVDTLLCTTNPNGQINYKSEVISTDREVVVYNGSFDYNDDGTEVTLAVFSKGASESGAGEVVTDALAGKFVIINVDGDILYVNKLINKTNTPEEIDWAEFVFKKDGVDRLYKIWYTGEVEYRCRSNIYDNLVVYTATFAEIKQEDDSWKWVAHIYSLTGEEVEIGSVIDEVAAGKYVILERNHIGGGVHLCEGGTVTGTDRFIQFRIRPGLGDEEIFRLYENGTVEQYYNELPSDTVYYKIIYYFNDAGDTVERVDIKDKVGDDVEIREILGDIFSDRTVILLNGGDTPVAQHLARTYKSNSGNALVAAEFIETYNFGTVYRYKLNYDGSVDYEEFSIGQAVNESSTNLYEAEFTFDDDDNIVECRYYTYDHQEEIPSTIISNVESEYKVAALKYAGNIYYATSNGVDPEDRRCATFAWKTPSFTEYIVIRDDDTAEMYRDQVQVSAQVNIPSVDVAYLKNISVSNDTDGSWTSYGKTLKISWKNNSTFNEAVNAGKVKLYLYRKHRSRTRSRKVAGKDEGGNELYSWTSATTNKWVHPANRFMESGEDNKTQCWGVLAMQGRPNSEGWQSYQTCSYTCGNSTNKGYGTGFVKSEYDITSGQANVEIQVKSIMSAIVRANHIYGGSSKFYLPSTSDRWFGSDGTPGNPGSDIADPVRYTIIGNRSTTPRYSTYKNTKHETGVAEAFGRTYIKQDIMFKLVVEDDDGNIIEGPASNVVSLLLYRYPLEQDPQWSNYRNRYLEDDEEPYGYGYVPNREFDYDSNDTFLRPVAYKVIIK